MSTETTQPQPEVELSQLVADIAYARRIISAMEAELAQRIEALKLEKRGPAKLILLPAPRYRNRSFKARDVRPRANA